MNNSRPILFDTPELQAARRKVLPWAMFVWLIALILGFWAIARSLDVVVALYAPFTLPTEASTQAYYGGTALRSFTAVVLGIAELAVGVGLVEYIYRNAGVKDVWTPLARVLAIEIAIIVLSFILA